MSDTMTKTDAAEPAAAKTVAAIDIGSNLLRMVIAQVSPAGEVTVLERLQRAVRLGQDTFRRGRLSINTMRAATGVLRDFRKKLDLYKVEKIRAVATSAVREASNADAFLDRVLMATGLHLEVIDTSEESRLTVSAVREDLADAAGIAQADVLIADVGGGSTLLTVLHRGQIESSQSLPLGAIRLQEALQISDEPPERSSEMLRRQITNVLAALQRSLPIKKVRAFVALGGDARFAAAQAGKPTASEALQKVTRPALDKLLQRCEGRPPEDLAREFGRPFADAETISTALMIYQELLRHTHVREMLVSHLSMRDGLLLDLARLVTGQEDTALVQGVIHSAMAVAEKYLVDSNHAEHVAELAMKLFDALADEHGLDARAHLLLHVAALVHEVGGFVSSRAHHKHSFYLISNSEIFGLSRREITIVAQVARYHRRSCPKPSHIEYMILPRETRMMISKLAALLRVADALDRGHAQQVRQFTGKIQGDEFVLQVRDVSDLGLERHAIATKGDLFQDIYGLRIRLEEAGTSDAALRRAAGAT